MMFMGFGWPTQNLEDLCEINIGRTPSRSEPRYWNGENPWLSISDINGQRLIEKTKEMISDAGVAECNCKLVPAGTVVLSFKLSIGKVAVTNKCMFTNEAIASLPVIDGKKLDKNFLYWALQNIDLMQGTDRAVMGKTLNKSKLKTLQIPLPPLEEQRRIAGILDWADALRRKQQQMLTRADEFLRATFLHMFGDPVTNPKGWEKCTIRNLVSEVRYGTSSKADPKRGKFPVLRMGNITYEGSWDLGDLKYIDLNSSEVEKYTVVRGDLLFNRTNSKELVGKAAVFEEAKPYAFAGYLIRVRVNNRADPYYISAYLNSKHGKATLQGMCKNIIGMANINAQEFQNIGIHTPPIKLQREHRSIIEAMSQKRRS